MNMVQRSVRRIASFVAKRALSYAGIPLRDPALMELFGMSGRTPAGVYVDERSANTLAAYYRGVALISSTVAMLRFECVQVSEEYGVIPDPDHISNEFFNIEPNPNMTWFQFAEMMTHYAITWGNGVAIIDRSPSGMPVALWPLNPSQVSIDLDDDGSKVFHFKARYKGEKDATYKDYEVLHIAGFGFDGIQGCSVVQYARDSLGLGIAIERFGAGFFGNNAVPGFVIEHPASVTLQGKNRIIDEIESVASGSDRARTGVVLDEGMKYKQVGVPPEDGQFLQSRQFQVREIARWLGVPPHMLYDLDNANFSTVEGQSLEFLTFTLAPWLQRWVQELRRKLLTVQERESNSHDFRVDTANLVMLDTNTKWDVYSKGRNLGYWTLNDIAKKERDKKLPSDVGDIRLTPSTMNPLATEKLAPAIEPLVITDSIALITSLRVPDRETALETLRTTIPSASDKFLNTLVNQLVTMGLCK